MGELIRNADGGAVQADLDGDTVVALDDDFGATDIAFVTPSGDIERLDGSAVPIDKPAPPGVATVDASEPIASADAVIERLATESSVIELLASDVIQPGASTDAAVQPPAMDDSVIERLASADSVIERLTSADSVIEFLASADSAIERLAGADSAIERLAGADSIVEFRAISERITPPLGTPRPTIAGTRTTADMAARDGDAEVVPPARAQPVRAVTAEFWPPPGPVPAGAHGPRRKARIFTAVEDESRDWLDSDQITVVPSPDDF